MPLFLHDVLKLTPSFRLQKPSKKKVSKHPVASALVPGAGSTVTASSSMTSSSTKTKLISGSNGNNGVGGAAIGTPAGSDSDSDSVEEEDDADLALLYDRPPKDATEKQSDEHLAKCTATRCAREIFFLEYA